jgi:protein-S-isoprenylcysteine O-methyltransferase Ste14
MWRLFFFFILSIPIIVLSWRSLSSTRNHGFYRFFSWESILWLLVSNYQFWFEDPFGYKQLISWALLLISIVYVILGSILLNKIGKPNKSKEREALFQFEKTTELVDQGIFKYIRHPLYGSLIILTWGIFLKNTTIPLLLVSLVSTVFLYLTALFDEKECIDYFGTAYREYMKRSKMFIPFLF